MSLITKLPSPLNTIIIENKTGSYKDFKTDGKYPLEGANFFADYGYIPGYIGEDGHDLDFFVGDDLEGKCGYFTVWRSNEVPAEHKYFVCMNESQLTKTLKEYEPVLTGEPRGNMLLEQVIDDIEKFRA